MSALTPTTPAVETRRLNEQIKRNLEQFPADFMFQLTAEEFDSLRSQFATLKTGRGQHRKYLPYAFTEHGAIMAAMVLASPRAVEVSVYVVRVFVRRTHPGCSSADCVFQYGCADAGSVITSSNMPLISKAGARSLSD